MTTGKALLGVLAGIAAGAAIGILFAPEKGSDTRNKITKKGKDLTDALTNKLDQKFDELISTVSGKGKSTKIENNYSSKREVEV